METKLFFGGGFFLLFFFQPCRRWTRSPWSGWWRSSSAAATRTWRTPWRRRRVWASSTTRTWCVTSASPPTARTTTRWCSATSATSAFTRSDVNNTQDYLNFWTENFSRTHDWNVFNPDHDDVSSQGLYCSVWRKWRFLYFCPAVAVLSSDAYRHFLCVFTCCCCIDFCSLTGSWAALLVVFLTRRVTASRRSQRAAGCAGSAPSAFCQSASCVPRRAAPWNRPVVEPSGSTSAVPCGSQRWRTVFLYTLTWRFRQFSVQTSGIVCRSQSCEWRQC